MRPAIKVGLSTASVYPLRAEAAFEYADRLGYDGVELMVWGESVSQDIDAVRKLSRRYRVPVLSVHAPCLLISQRVWGANPILKLDRSVRAAEQLGAQTVVVHPPFRWQRRYAEGFSDQVAALEAASTVMVAVENMFPFRADRFFGAGQSRERMRKRGGGPGPAISAFAPSYDPLDGNHAHYTLDLSQTFRSLARLTGAAPSMAGPRVKRTLTANGLRQLIAFISRMTAVDRAELEGVSADRAPQIVAGALVAEASMRALSIEAVEICPWALREGLILRKLDSEADGTALIESSSVHTSVRAVGGQPADRNAANRSRGSKP